MLKMRRMWDLLRAPQKAIVLLGVQLKQGPEKNPKIGSQKKAGNGNVSAAKGSGKTVASGANVQNSLEPLSNNSFRRTIEQ